MAQNSVINFKVFLRDSDANDIRRFSVDTPVVTNYMFLNEKLRNVFPVLRDAEYKITWKDSDGDEITIACDEDLITALTEMSGNLKVLYVTILQRNDDFRDDPVTIEADINVGARTVICDVCERTISGFRYKCLQCPDYDLCKECENKGHHTSHVMVRLSHTDSFPRFTRKLMHDISRNMKKNLRAARKEAYKFAKHCPKAAEGCSFASRDFPNRPEGANENVNANATSDNAGGQQAGSGPTGANMGIGGCPFASGDKVNMEDFHALGAMARQHLDPILNMLNVSQQTQTEQEGSERPLLFDIIQNAVDGFFGRYATPASNEQQNEKNQNTNQPSTGQTSTPSNGQQQPQTPAPNSNTSTPASAPMDLDKSSTPDTPQQSPPPAQQDKPAEPGWAFVTQNASSFTTPPPNRNNEPQSNAPTPTVIYHNNPVIAEGLTRLHEMGFSNDSGILTRLLERYEGDVVEVVKALVDLKI